MPAKLPPELTEPPPRRLRDLQIGETGYTPTSSMSVSTDGLCYLDPGALLWKDRSSLVIQVVRRENGYHVVVIAKGRSWTPGSTIPAGYIPVESVTRQLDPDLDLESQLVKIEARLKKLDRSA